MPKHYMPICKIAYPLLLFVNHPHRQLKIILLRLLGDSIETFKWNTMDLSFDKENYKIGKNEPICREIMPKIDYPYLVIQPFIENSFFKNKYSTKHVNN